MENTHSIQALENHIKQQIIGQPLLVNRMLIALLADGHLLVEGPPGLAKTRAIVSLSDGVEGDFHRIQFTPDLLPADITGTEIYHAEDATFKFQQGPLFHNLIFADEINRAPAKVQSALLEVMQERQVTIGDETFKIDLPFLVMATENPVEQEGAYELPEAQLDRFMMKVVVGYNTKEEEHKMVKRVANKTFGTIKAVITAKDLMEIKKEVLDIHIDKEVELYIINLIDATRNPEAYGLDNIKKYIQFGVSPRASIDMYKASRAIAYLKGQDYVSPIEIAYIAKEILRHRIILSYEAQAEDITQDYIIEKILAAVPIP